MTSYNYFNNKRILISGGAGFIGGALIRNLLKNSNSKIFNLDKFGYASDLTSINLTLKKIKEKDNHFIQDRYQNLEVNLENKTSVIEAIKYSNPDHIFHLAAESHVDRSINNPNAFIQSNINGTFNLLEAARLHFEKLSKNRRNNFKFQHISTDEVFGSLGCEGLFSEKSNYDPRSPYSASKAASDHLVSAWYYSFNLPILISNCSNNFGPWQFPEKLIPLVILKAISNKPIPIYGDGENIRDWLYVDDHIDALLMIGSKAELGSKYCIGGEKYSKNKKEITNNEVVFSICEILDEIYPSSSKYNNFVEYVKDRPGHDQRYAIDSSKIFNELGWEPKRNFKDSLRETINWYIKNLNWCNKIMENSNYDGHRLGL